MDSCSNDIVPAKRQLLEFVSGTHDSRLYQSLRQAYHRVPSCALRVSHERGVCNDEYESRACAMICSTLSDLHSEVHLG